MKNIKFSLFLSLMSLDLKLCIKRLKVFIQKLDYFSEYTENPKYLQPKKYIKHI